MNTCISRLRGIEARINFYAGEYNTSTRGICLKLVVLYGSAAIHVIRTIWDIWIYSVLDLDLRWLVYAVQCHFQQYFNYIVEVSFIGGENH